MNRRLILASANAAKLREISMFMLEGSSWDVVPQQVHGIDPTAEPHLTFVENALTKARHAAARTGLPALADDSGLCVESLNGAPGVWSARFAGEGASLRHDPERGQTRWLVCQSGNPFGLPAKDRSGRLDVTEPPDLGALLRKINIGSNSKG